MSILRKSFSCGFGIGQEVYIKHDPEQVPRMITRVTFSSNDYVYEVSSGVGSSSHYEIELSEDKDYKFV